jgi:hypothetical protein
MCPSGERGADRSVRTRSRAPFPLPRGATTVPKKRPAPRCADAAAPRILRRAAGLRASWLRRTRGACLRTSGCRRCRRDAPPAARSCAAWDHCPRLGPSRLRGLSTGPTGTRRPITPPGCGSSPAGSSPTPATRWACTTAGAARRPGRASTARASCTRPTARSDGSFRARAGISCAWAGRSASRGCGRATLLFTEGGGHLQLVVSKRTAISAPRTGERVRYVRLAQLRPEFAGGRRVLK